MPHRDVNVQSLLEKQASTIQKWKLETDKLYEQRKRILDKYLLTDDN